jgi:hypothetical protein
MQKVRCFTFACKAIAIIEILGVLFLDLRQVVVVAEFAATITKQTQGDK